MAKKSIPPLYVEPISNPSNFFFLSVLQYKKETYLVVIDNITEEHVTAYVVERAKQENVDVYLLLEIISEWYEESSERYPISIEFSKRGITSVTNKLLKKFELNHVIRVIGRDFKFDLTSPPKIRRRRVQNVQTTAIDISIPD